jgi:hypothetical protein
MRNMWTLPAAWAELPRFQGGRGVNQSVFSSGTFSFLVDEPDFLARVATYFGQTDGRNPLGIKVWRTPIFSDRIDEFEWGSLFHLREESEWVPGEHRLLDALKAQNFASFFGFAPRIHGLFVLASTVGSNHYAILMDRHEIVVEEEEEGLRRFREIEGFCAQYGLRPPFGDLANPGTNFSSQALVDWQSARLEEAHWDFLRAFGQGVSNSTGVSFDQLAVNPTPSVIQHSEAWLESLRLPSLEFSGRSVVQVGCGDGTALNYALARGARIAVGIDSERSTQAARFNSNALGHFNVQYEGGSGPGVEPPSVIRGRTPFDFALFLESTYLRTMPEYLHDLARILVLEVKRDAFGASEAEHLDRYWHVFEIWKPDEQSEQRIFHCYSRKHFEASDIDLFHPRF